MFKYDSENYHTKAYRETCKTYSVLWTQTFGGLGDPKKLRFIQIRGRKALRVLTLPIVRLLPLEQNV